MVRQALTVLACLALAGPAAGEPRSVGKWLVDLGRDYPLSPQAGLADADARIALLFMEGQREEALEVWSDIPDALDDDAIGVTILHLEVQQDAPQAGTRGRVFALAFHADRSGPFTVMNQLCHVERMRAPVGDHAFARIAAAHPARS